MSEEFDPSITVPQPQPQSRFKGNQALSLPDSPSDAFINNVFETNFIDPVRTVRDMSFQDTDFRGPRGDNARKLFGVKTRKSFGPQNLPNIRRKNIMDFDF